MWLSIGTGPSGATASMVGFVVWLQATPISHFIAKANHLLVAALQILHVFGLIFLLAPLILIALRVLGLVLREQPLEDVLGQARIVSLLGLISSLSSGVFMFLSAPLHYYANWAFDAKMSVLLGALVIYGLIFSWVPAWVRAHAALARVHILFSLLLWIIVCMAGRAIGFV